MQTQAIETRNLIKILLIKIISKLLYLLTDANWKRFMYSNSEVIPEKNFLRCPSNIRQLALFTQSFKKTWNFKKLTAPTIFSRTLSRFNKCFAETHIDVLVFFLSKIPRVISRKNKLINEKHYKLFWHISFTLQTQFKHPQRYVI